VGLENGHVEIHELEINKSSLTEERKIHTARVRDCRLSERDNVIITASFDNTVGILRGDNLKSKDYFRKHQERVKCCSYGDKLCASGGYDKTVRVWDPNTAKEISTFKEGSIVFGCDISSDDRFLCSDHGSGVHGRRWCVWDCRSGNRVRKTPWRGWGPCRISPCGEFVSVCGIRHLGVFSICNGKQMLVKDVWPWDTEWISPSRVLMTSYRDTLLFNLTSSRSHSVGRGARHIGTALGVAVTVKGDSLSVWKVAGFEVAKYYCRFTRVQERLHNVGEDPLQQNGLIRLGILSHIH